MTDATRRELDIERERLRASMRHLQGRVAAIDQLLDDVPVHEVPPDWVGNDGVGCYPDRVDPGARPTVAWWAKHPDGTYSPVYAGSKRANSRRLGW